MLSAQDLWVRRVFKVPHLLLHGASLFFLSHSKDYPIRCRVLRYTRECGWPIPTRDLTGLSIMKILLCSKSISKALKQPFIFQPITCISNGDKRIIMIMQTKYSVYCFTSGCSTSNIMNSEYKRKGQFYCAPMLNSKLLCYETWNTLNICSFRQRIQIDDWQRAVRNSCLTTSFYKYIGKHRQIFCLKHW
jgi:hypothetical protein